MLKVLSDKAFGAQAIIVVFYASSNLLSFRHLRLFRNRSKSLISCPNVYIFALCESYKQVAYAVSLSKRSKT